MSIDLITYDAARGRIDWTGAIDALRQGHLAGRPQLGDLFLGPSDGTLLNRAAYLPGVGYGVKAVTVFDQNPTHGLPTVQGAMMFFEPDRGTLRAVIESALVTEFKTAGDSVLGAQLLARPDSANLLILGAGTLARGLVRAYAAGMPQIRDIRIWARRPEQALDLVRQMADEGYGVTAVTDLRQAAGQADIISTATMARQPVLEGAWVRPGTHVDLIGAYKADMREADDDLIRKGRLFVDSRETTIHHIGELTIPLAAGVLTEADVIGDLYDLVPGRCGRLTSDEITIFKNGGGAHLDTMIAAHIAARMAGRPAEAGG